MQSDHPTSRPSGGSGSPRYELAKRVAAGGERCRCGVRIQEGALCFGFDRVPPSLAGLLEGRVFCSLRCVRAFGRDTLQVLDVPAANSWISDAREVHATVQALFLLG